jgi:hypothetical protein
MYFLCIIIIILIKRKKGLPCDSDGLKNKKVGDAESRSGGGGGGGVEGGWTTPTPTTTTRRLQVLTARTHPVGTPSSHQTVSASLSCQQLEEELLGFDPQQTTTLLIKQTSQLKCSHFFSFIQNK